MNYLEFSYRLTGVITSEGVGNNPNSNGIIVVQYYRYFLN